MHTPQRCIMPLQTQHRLVPFPRLHRMHTQAAVRFINYDGECVIEAGGKRSVMMAAPKKTRVVGADD